MMGCPRAIDEGGAEVVESDEFGRCRRKLRGSDSRRNSQLLKPSITLGEDTRGEVAERAECDGEQVRRLKGGDIRACVYNHLMALPREELACRGDRTMAVVRRRIVKELLPVRGTGEGPARQAFWAFFAGSLFFKFLFFRRKRKHCTVGFTKKKDIVALVQNKLRM
jgi:hypothetical protein